MQRLWPSFPRGLCWALFAMLPTISSASTSLLSATSISVTPSFVSNVPKDTHTATTGSDGKATPVPIVGGSKCWFCPSQGDHNSTTGGWALLGINGAGVYQPSSSQLQEPIPVITVSVNGDPTYASSPTKNGPPTRVKRYDNLPTETRVLVHGRLAKLMEAAPNVRQWTIGSAHGLRIKTMTTWNGVPVPKHYWLAAGLITETVEWIMVYGCDDQPLKWEETHLQDFEAYSYDIQAPFQPRPRQISFRGVDGDGWYHQPGALYKYLGPMRTDVTAGDIYATGIELANEMNLEGYNTVFNNCGDFVKRLWTIIKA